MKRIFVTLMVLAMISIQAVPSQAHTLSWRAGESRTKGIGICAKGPCMRRADFSPSKPHHHHGARVIVGMNRHTWRCPVEYSRG